MTLVSHLGLGLMDFQVTFHAHYRLHDFQSFYRVHLTNHVDPNTDTVMGGAPVGAGGHDPHF